MTSRPIVIPTPHSITTLAQGRRPLATGATLRIHAPILPGEQGRFVLRFLRQYLPQPARLAAADRADLVLRIDPTVDHDQGYRLRIDPVGPVTCDAATPVGLLYAGATLLQLLDEVGNVPMLAIDDQPAFNHRGNNWLQQAEITGWSYARGDDLPTIEKRMVAKLDMAALHKVNWITFDGFNWDVGKYPGHAAFMRRMNHAAKLRGIRLCFGGYGAYNDGQDMLNRRSYPDGEVYPCMGMNDAWQRITGTAVRGTCVSNDALTARRAARLTKFIKAVRPGALYYHSIDTATVAESDHIWQKRCPLCRKRWPDDDVTSPRGMAGAFAAFYAEIAKAVRRDDPDCLLMVVSPGYTAYAESDHAWRRDCDYWVTVSRLVKEPNMVIGLREQFTNRRGRQLRYTQLRERLHREAHGHAIANIYFFGGDIFYNSHPYLATPMLNAYFRGADFVINGNGNGYQEPQQLLNAECMWNPAGSAWFSPPPIETYDNMHDGYIDLCTAATRPRETDAFLEHACRRLYGAKDGPRVAQMLRLQGKAKLGSPQFTRYEKPVIWLPVFNYLAPNQRSFRHSGVVWQPDIDAAQIRRLRAVYRDVASLNAEAMRILKPCKHEDVVAMREAIALARRYAVMLADFVDVFLEAHRAMSHKDRSTALDAVTRYRRRLGTFHRAMTQGLPDKTLPTDIESTARRTAAEQIRNRLDPIALSLRTGRFSDQS